MDGDLLEGFGARERRHGRTVARRWYWTQVLRSAGPLALTSLGDVSPGRWVAGASAGILTTSVAPAAVDALLRPAAIGGFALTAWFAIVGLTAAVGGGYLASRLAGVRSAAPIAALVGLFYAPALVPLLGGAGPLPGELAWLAGMVTCAVVGGGLAARRRAGHR